MMAALIAKADYKKECRLISRVFWERKYQYIHFKYVMRIITFKKYFGGVLEIYQVQSFLFIYEKIKESRD